MKQENQNEKGIEMRGITYYVHRYYEGNLTIEELLGQMMKEQIQLSSLPRMNMRTVEVKIA